MFEYFEVNTSWSDTDTRVFLPIFFALIFFVAYWFTAQSDKIKALFFAKNDPDQASIKHIFFTKYFGFISMGVVPTILCLIFVPNISLADYGLTVIPETTMFTLAWTIGLSILVIPLAYFSAKKPKNLVNYPQIRAKKWTRKTLFINLLGWALYLFGYEFLFRGTLLIPLVEPLGVWPAIAINIALYSATHIPKGLDETLGAIPLGLVLCLLTLASGTIWIAFIVHVAMAWTNSLTALKHHPDIHLQK
ncbi:MAG: CPBP family glutamic-type intramembrane protease [Crocinitomicaceae bacterium]|nr:CPBP family glutamic-type intramembrane protease [Crocinitomicaceae bacterium]